MRSSFQQPSHYQWPRIRYRRRSYHIPNNTVTINGNIHNKEKQFRITTNVGNTLECTKPLENNNGTINRVGSETIFYDNMKQLLEMTIMAGMECQTIISVEISSAAAGLLN